MTFPIKLNVNVESHNGNYDRSITLQSGLTVLIGPNGSGKTHLLRALKNSLRPHTKDKKVRFLSAGRMGLLEQYRSDFNGHHGGNPLYNNAQFGSKSDVVRRHNIETLEGDFQTLSERADILIKVQERLRKLFKRDILIEWDGGSLKVSFARLDGEDQPYSSGREASGLLHLVGILAALYDDDVGALLLDEPEVSLHPQLQAFLLNEIISASGHPSEGSFKKIIVIATHSTEMLRVLKCDDLLSLLFCHDLSLPPAQVDPSAEELKNQKLQTLVARLGQEHKLSLFCRRPLLVEGPSDMLLCSFISQKLELHLEAAGSQILPVIGTGQMPVVSKFMKLLGKTPIVLADADTFADGLDLTNYFLKDCEEANRKATGTGAKSATQLATTVYNDFCNLVIKSWDDISAIAISHPYWINRKDISDAQAKKRACFCSLFEIDDSKLNELKSGAEWTTIKRRIEAILDLLELAGCFILRKGAVESYYKHADRLTSEGKPSAAVDEISHLDTLDSKDIYENFPEMVRCIKFASLADQISEAESLRDLLLSIAAPAMAKLNSGTTTQEIKILSKTILREKSGIFDLSIEDDKLVVKLQSKILNVSGFPMYIRRGDDVIKAVESTLC
ncbi:ATP-dependent endonuclease [Pseudomonas sp. B22(2017)]|uniref:ATP-dependent nuclease n=1 Tax=Pseudomonas sp. B22(2017) TaxID=1981736 RepID=UPI000A1EEA7A|nr:AAA family ATPase [Pseudomonas sp. B22(2017)]